MLNLKTKIDFEHFQTHVPIIKFKISGNDCWFYGIIDTGSESTVIDDGFVDKHKERFVITPKHDMSLIGLGGDAKYEIRDVSSNFVFNGNKCMVSGITSDLREFNKQVKQFCDNKLNISVIFGSDMLYQLNTLIDFKNKKVKFRL